MTNYNNTFEDGYLEETEEIHAIKSDICDDLMDRYQKNNFTHTEVAVHLAEMISLVISCKETGEDVNVANISCKNNIFESEVNVRVKNV